MCDLRIVSLASFRVAIYYRKLYIIMLYINIIMLSTFDYNAKNSYEIAMESRKSGWMEQAQDRESWQNLVSEADSLWVTTPPK